MTTSTPNLLQRGQSDLAEDMGFQRRAEIVDGHPDRDIRSRGVSCRGDEYRSGTTPRQCRISGPQRPVQDPQLAPAEPFQCTRNMRAVVQCALYLTSSGQRRDADAACVHRTPPMHALNIAPVDFLERRRRVRRSRTGGGRRHIERWRSPDRRLDVFRRSKLRAVDCRLPRGSARRSGIDSSR